MMSTTTRIPGIPALRHIAQGDRSVTIWERAIGLLGMVVTDWSLETDASRTLVEVLDKDAGIHPVL